MLEPADSQECKLTSPAWPSRSPKPYDTPVMLRTTTRISHANRWSTLGEPDGETARALPGAQRRQAGDASRQCPQAPSAGGGAAGEAGGWACKQPCNRLEVREGRVGIITSGVCYNYAREVIPDASTLKLGLVHPLPKAADPRLRRDGRDPATSSRNSTLHRGAGQGHGHRLPGEGAPLPVRGTDPGRFCAPPWRRWADRAAGRRSRNGLPELPPRPPNMCPGCPHRGVFFALNQLKAYVTGDIGCYTLGFMPPLSAMDTCVCMGASIGNATGVVKVVPRGGEAQGGGGHRRLDLPAHRHQRPDGHGLQPGAGDPDHSRQPHHRHDRPPGQPGFGLHPVMDEGAPQVDFVQLCRALGVRHVSTVDPFDLAETKAVIAEEMARPEAVGGDHQPSLRAGQAAGSSSAARSRR